MEQIRKEAGVDSEGREAVLSWATIDRVNDGGRDGNIHTDYEDFKKFD